MISFLFDVSCWVEILIIETVISWVLRGPLFKHQKHFREFEIKEGGHPSHSKSNVREMAAVMPLQNF